jgi:hypothetical protein
MLMRFMLAALRFGLSVASFYHVLRGKKTAFRAGVSARFAPARQDFAGRRQNYPFE